MPCDSVRLNTLNLKCADLNLLKKALTALGYKVYSADERVVRFSGGTIYRQAGTITVQAGQEHIADAIKKQYSKEVMEEAAHVFGWDIVDGEEANQFTMQRRV